MTSCRLRLRPLSPWATPWHADTLFGCLCWKCAQIDQKLLISWLDRFRNNDPPFVISDALPGTNLPLPFGISPPQSPGKKPRPPLFITEANFQQLSRDPSQKVLQVWAFNDRFRSSERLQAAIGRMSGTTGGDDAGGLFEVDHTHFVPDAPQFPSARSGVDFVPGAPRFLSVYVRTDQKTLPMLVACLERLAYCGFGKKSSTGLGAFAVEGAPEPCPWLDDTTGHNGFVSLSHFVPAKTDPADGYWRQHVSYPKFHGSAVANPFKGTLLSLMPGSRFRTGEPPRYWYGRTIEVSRPEIPGALHYGLSFAAPVTIEPEATAA